MTIRFYAVDGDTYNGGDIDLSFHTYADAKAAYGSIKAPFKLLRAFGSETDKDGVAHQVTIEFERFHDKAFYN